MKRKGKFLTFCFSCIPGVGHMYLGFMKQGISILLAACALIFFSAWMELGPLMLLMPVLWFYSFFDAINKNSLNDEEFYALEDDYLFHLEEITPTLNNLLSGKLRLVAGIVCLLIGLNLLVNNMAYYFVNVLGWDFVGYITSYLNRLPQIIVALLIILFGLYLIKGKKTEMHQLEDKEAEHEDK